MKLFLDVEAEPIQPAPISVQATISELTGTISPSSEAETIDGKPESPGASSTEGTTPRNGKKKKKKKKIKKRKPKDILVQDSHETEDEQEIVYVPVNHQNYAFFFSSVIHFFFCRK